MEVVANEVELTATTARLAAAATGLAATFRTQLQFNYRFFAAFASASTTTATTTTTARAAATAGLAVAFRTQLQFDYGLFAAATSTSAGGDIN